MINLSKKQALKISRALGKGPSKDFRRAGIWEAAEHHTYIRHFRKWQRQMVWKAYRYLK